LREKLALYGTAGRLLMKGRIHLPKVEHTAFEGHVMLNEDECQKYDGL